MEDFICIEGSEPVDIRVIRHGVEKDLIVTLYQLEEEEIDAIGYLEIRTRLAATLDRIHDLQRLEGKLS